MLWQSLCTTPRLVYHLQLGVVSYSRGERFIFDQAKGLFIARLYHETQSLFSLPVHCYHGASCPVCQSFSTANVDFGQFQA